MNQIKYGHVSISRKLWLEYIASLAPCARELFFYLLMCANFKANETDLKICRGQVFVDYSGLLKQLAWNVGFRVKRYTKHELEAAFKALRNAGAITTAKTTRGMIVTICNYDAWVSSGG